MAEHEPSIGATSEWFTPPEYFEDPEPRPLTAKTGFESPRERHARFFLFCFNVFANLPTRVCQSFVL